MILYSQGKDKTPDRADGLVITLYSNKVQDALMYIIRKLYTNICRQGGESDGTGYSIRIKVRRDSDTKEEISL